MPANGNGKNKNDGGGGSSINIVTGTDGNDIIGAAKLAESDVEGVTTAEADLVYAGAGDDWIYGYAGDDIIYGEAGNDFILPGTGEDTVYGGDGYDVVHYDFLFVEEPDIKEGKGKNAGSVQITYTYEQDGQLVTETDTLWSVEAILFANDTPDSPSAVVLDIENASTDYLQATTAIGSGIVGLTDSGFYLLATTTAGGGTLEDASARVEDQDGSGDLEFRISTDADGTTHEINVQSAFDLSFDFVSAEVEGLDETDQVLVSIAADQGFFIGMTVLQVDATAAASDGVIEASELVGLKDANGYTVQAADLQGIDQLMFEAGNTAGSDTFWMDNIEVA